MKSYLFILILMFSSCEYKSTMVLEGKYKAINSVKKYQHLIGSNNQVNFVVATQLTLSDSIFFYKTCAIKGEGTCKITNDTLQLQFKKVNWIHSNVKDSLDSSAFIEMSYSIIDDYLFRTVDKSSNTDLVELLEKK